jgi:hypothetical protein
MVILPSKIWVLSYRLKGFAVTYCDRVEIRDKADENRQSWISPANSGVTAMEDCFDGRHSQVSFQVYTN